MEKEIMAADFLERFKDWAMENEEITGVAVVGSFARGDFHADSDIDVTIISTSKQAVGKQLLTSFSYNKVARYQIEEWGMLTAHRVFYNNGMEIEYGLVTDQWTAEPLDKGTKAVVRDGFTVLLDKQQIFFNVEKYLASLS